MTITNKMRLLVGTAILGLIGLVWLGQSKITDVYEKTNFANRNSVPAIIALGNASESLGRLRIRAYLHVLVNDDFQQKDIESKIQEAKNGVTNAFKDYEATLVDAEDRQLFVEDKSAFNDYLQGMEKAIEYSHQKQKDMARDILMQNVEKAEKATAVFNAHMDYNINLAQKAAQNAATTKTEATNLFWLIAAMVLLTVAWLGWMIARNLMRQLGAEPDFVASLANKIASGDLNTPINLTQGDTTSIMAAMKNMMQAIQSLVNDADSLSNSAIVGHLNERADATKHQGDFRKVVEGVNLTLDYLVGYIDNMPLPTMIIDNEFSIQYMNKRGLELGSTSSNRLQGSKCFDYFKTGDCGTSKCACNNAMKNVAMAKSETIAKPGNLELDIHYIATPIKDKKGNVIGAFEIVMDQTEIKKAQRVARKIANYQQQEVAKVQAALTQMAEGNINVQLTVAEADQDTLASNETFTIIAGAVNQAAKSIQNLVIDAIGLSQAAIEGRLSTRADATQHQGDFRKIVEGVNETLDAVILPLNVAADYVENIARGKIPAKITDHYNGDFNILKNNLNLCIDAINALVRDANVLAVAAEEGRLDTRADTSKHQGDFRKIVEGVNNTLDGVILPVNEAIDVLIRVEQGDLTQTIEGDYQGQLNDFKETVNNTISKLSQTIAEVVSATYQLSSASGQISSTSESLSQAASEQAASVEQTSASMEEMSASINQNAENAKITDAIAGKATQEAVESGVAVTQTVEAMKNIASKIDIIDEIAYQTNMLALNAAIEAARAGDHGKGFAVVASEVRKLAERSQIAAREIGDLAESSVKTAETAGQLLKAMVPSITKTSDLVQEIAAASQEQSAGANQVNIAMNQMNQITQQNASASEELASTAEEMSSQAEQLQNLMRFFKINEHASMLRHRSSKSGKKLKKAKPAVQINCGDDSDIHVDLNRFERF